MRQQLLDAKRTAAAELLRARQELGAWSNLDGSFNIKQYYQAFTEKLSTGGQPAGWLAGCQWLAGAGWLGLAGWLAGLWHAMCRTHC